VIGTLSNSKTFTVRPAARFKSRLAKARRFILYMDIDVEDADNHTITKSYRIAVIR
jgi:hypothetical protein